MERTRQGAVGKDQTGWDSAISFFWAKKDGYIFYLKDSSKGEKPDSVACI